MKSLDDLSEAIEEIENVGREITCGAQEQARATNAKYVEIPRWRVVEVDDRREEAGKM